MLRIGLLAFALTANTALAWHVQGKIVCDDDGDGVISASDMPLEGVVVTVQNADGSFTGATATDANGVFRLDLPHVNDSYVASLDRSTVPSGATVISPLGGVQSFVLTNENQFFEQADFLLDCSPHPGPRPGDCGKVTGGGWIVTSAGAKANFGVSGGPGNWGHLNYVDHGSKLHVRSTAVTGFQIDPLNPNACTIHYDVLIGSIAGTAIVYVVDNGEPGTRDRFELTLSNGYREGGQLAGDRPGGGNIQMHKCPPGKKK
jgi:hypothetical protein